MPRLSQNPSQKEIQEFNEALPFLRLENPSLIEIRNEIEKLRHTLRGLHENPSTEEINSEIENLRAYATLVLNEKSSYYTILGVKPDAKPDEISKQWRQLLLIWHPDKFHKSLTSDKKSAIIQKIHFDAIIRKINLAHETLIDPNHRAAYDLADNSESESKPEFRRKYKSSPPYSPHPFSLSLMSQNPTEDTFRQVPDNTYILSPNKLYYVLYSPSGKLNHYSIYIPREHKEQVMKALWEQLGEKGSEPYDSPIRQRRYNEDRIIELLTASCHLILMSSYSPEDVPGYVPIDKRINEVPAYILGPKGLYYVGQQNTPLYNLVLISNDQNVIQDLWKQLGTKSGAPHEESIKKMDCNEGRIIASLTKGGRQQPVPCHTPPNQNQHLARWSIYTNSYANEKELRKKAVSTLRDDYHKIVELSSNILNIEVQQAKWLQFEDGKKLKIDKAEYERQLEILKKEYTTAREHIYGKSTVITCDILSTKIKSITERYRSWYNYDDFLHKAQWIRHESRMPTHASFDHLIEQLLDFPNKVSKESFSLLKELVSAKVDAEELEISSLTDSSPHPFASIISSNKWNTLGGILFFTHTPTGISKMKTALQDQDKTLAQKHRKLYSVAQQHMNTSAYGLRDNTTIAFYECILAIGPKLPTNAKDLSITLTAMRLVASRLNRYHCFFEEKQSNFSFSCRGM